MFLLFHPFTYFLPLLPTSFLHVLPSHIKITTCTYNQRIDHRNLSFFFLLFDPFPSHSHSDSILFSFYLSLSFHFPPFPEQTLVLFPGSPSLSVCRLFPVVASVLPPPSLLSLCVPSFLRATPALFSFSRCFCPDWLVTVICTVFPLSLRDLWNSQRLKGESRV